MATTASSSTHTAARIFTFLFTTTSCNAQLDDGYPRTTTPSTPFGVSGF
jgi:hypothetical protein